MWDVKYQKLVDGFLNVVNIFIVFNVQLDEGQKQVSDALTPYAFKIDGQVSPDEACLIFKPSQGHKLKQGQGAQQPEIIVNEF